MSWRKTGGLAMIVLGLISFVFMVIFGWDISLQMLALQRQFFAENWYLLLNTMTCFFFGVIIIGSE